MPLLSAPELAASNRKSQEQLLPARGVKQYAPSNSWLESKQIQSAVEERKSILQAERIEKWSSRACASWLADKNVAEVTRKVGKHFQTMGCEKGGKLLLQPEEALYLMETNILELEYGEVAMSIQQAYALLLGPHCTLAEYRTYSKLQRLGLVVRRHTDFLPLREPQASGIKRQHEPENEIIPSKKKTTNIASPKKAEPKIELIDLEDDEPSGFELFVPDIIGKDNVYLKIPPHDLLPDNSRPRGSQYFIKPRNLQQPGQGARPLPPQHFPSNYYQGQPWQFNRPIFNQIMNPMIQRYIGMNLSNSVYPRFMQRNANFNARFPFQQFLRANFNNRMNFNFPFLPRMNTTLNTTQTTQFYANTVANHQFLSIGRTVIQQTSHQISYPPPLISNFQASTQHVPPVPRNPSNNNNNSQDTNLTPPPNPIVPKLKAKSWAEVKAKLASTVEIITLDEDDGSETAISPDKPLLQPEDCSSLGTIMSKLQIFKKSQCSKVEKTSILIKFDAFQPSIPFRKSEIRPPDFHVIVINHPDTLLSDVDFVGNGASVPVLYAIVQPDTINFFLLSDVKITLPAN